MLSRTEQQEREDLRILYLNHNPAGVGAWQRASNFGRARRGHEVTLLTTHPHKRFGFETLEEGSYTEVRAPDLFSGPARTGWDPTNALRRMMHLRGHAPDLVHAFDSRPVVILPALSSVRRSGALLFLDWADWWGRGGRIEECTGWWVRTFFGPLETWFEEAFRTHADGTTTTSRALASRAERLGLDPDSIWTLPNGCDEQSAPPVPRDEARKALGLSLSLDAPLVLHAGVLPPADMSQLTSALELLIREIPEARLVLAGNHTAPIPAGVAARGIVRPLGFVPREQLRLWLGAADLRVTPLTDTPNNQGRWPGRLNDYLEAGRPTVMPAVGDAAELIGKNGAGWTCQANANSLAQSMLQALRDSEARRDAGARARSLAIGPLAWSALAERLESAYNATLARRTALRRQTERKAPLSQHNVPTLSDSVRSSNSTESRPA